MRRSTKDTVKGTLHEVKGKVKEKMGRSTTTSAWKPKAGSKKSVGKCRRKSAEWRRLSENRSSASLKEFASIGNVMKIFGSSWGPHSQRVWASARSSSRPCGVVCVLVMLLSNAVSGQWLALDQLLNDWRQVGDTNKDHSCNREGMNGLFCIWAVSISLLNSLLNPTIA